jgi:hypothetical protein
MLEVLRHLVFRKNGVGGAFGFAEGAIDAFVGIDDQEVGALMEAIDRANIDTISIFALNAVFGYYESHFKCPNTVKEQRGLMGD